MTQRLPKPKLVCQFCGTEFSATRSDTRFCCDNHRVAYSRWAMRLTARHVAIQRQIVLIAEYMQFPDARPAAIDVLKHIAAAATLAIGEKKTK